MSITKLQDFKYECDECRREWVMTNPSENFAYFCPYCGKQQPIQNLFGEYHNAESKHYKKPAPTPAPKDFVDQDFIEPSVDEVKHPTTIVQKKTPERIYAEDRMTHKVCEDGWWNPVTKKCQGEGNGHNVVDNDE